MGWPLSSHLTRPKKSFSVRVSAILLTRLISALHVAHRVGRSQWFSTQCNWVDEGMVKVFLQSRHRSCLSGFALRQFLQYRGVCSWSALALNADPQILHENVAHFASHAALHALQYRGVSQSRMIRTS